MQFEPKLFNPRSDPTRSFAASDDAVGFSIGAAPEDCYIYSPAVVLAINVAMATRRPLLVSG